MLPKPPSSVCLILDHRVRENTVPLLLLLWRTVGYRIKLFFLRLKTPEMAIARVRQRVIEGGHDVPEDIIRRRFATGLLNFEVVPAFG